MKFSPKCRTKKLGMIYTILESFCSFSNWDGADIRPQIRPRKIPVFVLIFYVPVNNFKVCRDDFLSSCVDFGKQ